MTRGSSTGGGDTGGGFVLVDVRIDEVTWSSASEERRREWRVVLDELIAEHRFAGAASLEAPVALHVCIDSTQAGEAAALLRDEIALAAMADSLREYFSICREMGSSTEGPNSPRLEAL